MEPWNRGTVEPWNRGTTELRNRGTTELLNKGAMRDSKEQRSIDDDVRKGLVHTPALIDNVQTMILTTDD